MTEELGELVALVNHERKRRCNLKHWLSNHPFQAYNKGGAFLGNFSSDRCAARTAVFSGVGGYVTYPTEKGTLATMPYSDLVALVNRPRRSRGPVPVYRG